MSTSDLERRRARAVAALEREAARHYGNGQRRKGGCFEFAARRLEANDPEPMRQVMQLRAWPVTIEEFLDGRRYLGGQQVLDVWPTLRDLIVQVNPDVLAGEPPVSEVLFAGASGTGKTTVAIISLVYLLHVLHCFKSPHRAFNLSPVFPITVTLQSVSFDICKKILFEPLRNLVLATPWFRDRPGGLTWERNTLKSRLEFSSRINVVPALAMETSLQSQAVIGGILDEMAFMQVFESSKRVPGPRGEGGAFDQAETVHRAALSRRQRSFSSERGFSFGGFFVLSNTRYKGDFLDRRLEEVERHPRPGVFVRRMRRHETNPKDIADIRSGRSLRVLVGTDRYGCRELGPDEVPPDGAEVDVVSAEHRGMLVDDPGKFMREVLGRATDTITPFISRVDHVDDAFWRGTELGMMPWVEEQDVVLDRGGLPEWVVEQMSRDRHTPRWAHVDLSKSHDRCGVSVIKPLGFIHVPVGGYDADDQDEDENLQQLHEALPTFAVEVAVSILPSARRNIEPALIRSWLAQLLSIGYPLHSVTYDGFNSQESVQQWRAAEVRSEVVSVDRTTEPYMHLRSALYHGRVAFVESEILRQELVGLEYRADKEKIDHPPKLVGKDLADAVAAATWQCSKSRWLRENRGFWHDDGRPMRGRDEGRVVAPVREQGRRLRTAPMRSRVRLV